MTTVTMVNHDIVTFKDGKWWFLSGEWHKLDVIEVRHQQVVTDATETLEIWRTTEQKPYKVNV